MFITVHNLHSKAHANNLCEHYLNWNVHRIHREQHSSLSLIGESILNNGEWGDITDFKISGVGNTVQRFPLKVVAREERDVRNSGISRLFSLKAIVQSTYRCLLLFCNLNFIEKYSIMRQITNRLTRLISTSSRTEWSLNVTVNNSSPLASS